MELKDADGVRWERRKSAKRHRRAKTGSFLIYLALFACSNKGDVTGPAEITSVMIEGPSLIAVGETTQMTAQPLDNGGDPISGSSIRDGAPPRTLSIKRTPTMRRC